MTNIAIFFMKNYKFTFVMTIGVVVFGVMGLRDIKSESYPAVAFAVATITTSLDGASAEEIETQITKPIEDEIRSVSGIKDVRSTSQPGLSTIIVRADIDNVVVDEVMTDLQRAIDRVSDLPPEIKDKPKFTEVKSEEFPVIEIAVLGSNDDRQRDIIANRLKEDIEDNKSVLNVRLSGYKDRQFNIQLDSDKMDFHHVGIDQVVDKIKMRNTSVPGGKLEKFSEQKLVRIKGDVENKSDIENIVIRSNFSGKTVLLKDVGSVEDGEETIKVLTKYDGKDATLLVVNKKGGADTIEMVDDIQKKIAHFTTMYEGKADFIVYNNESTRVSNKLGILSSNAITGLGLVFFFLLLFLPGRIGLVASLSLPLGVMATMGFLPILGMNLNAITILALVIALGMLVDNSVVIAENYARLRQDGQSREDAAINSIRTLWLPISATVFTTIAAFLPMLVTTGVMGQFIKYIPIIVSLSLLISLFESFFLLPMRLTRIDARNVKISDTGIFEKLSYKFEALVHWLVRYRYLTLLAFTASLALSVSMMVVFNKMILFPSEQVELYVARVEMEKGYRLDDTNTSLATIIADIDSVAGKSFKHVTSRAGISQMSPMDPKKKEGDHIGSIYMYATDETKNTVSSVDMLEKLRTIKAAPGVKSLAFEAAVNGPPVGEPINVTFRSNNVDSLNAVVDSVTGVLEKTAGVRDINVDTVVGDDEVYIDIDYAKADRLGLDVTTIGQSVRPAISGKNVSSVTLHNKEVQLNVRMRETNRLSTSDINNVRISDRRGNLIPLGSIAMLRVEAGGPQIKRFDFKRSKTIAASIDDKTITVIAANTIVMDQYKELQAQYPDVAVVFGGEGESTNESLASLFNALIISLICIFALLVFLFNSFIAPFIIMTTIPLGLVGFSIAFAAHGKPISFLAMIGVIGLGGIIVNSGIILISFINELRSESDRPLADVLATASRLRLRAVVVSSLTTISGLLPTAYGIGGMDAFLMPLTLAMAWGLTSGTILTLLWIPCAYAISEDFNSLFRKIFSRNNQSDEPQNFESNSGKLKEAANQ